MDTEKKPEPQPEPEPAVSSAPKHYGMVAEPGRYVLRFGAEPLPPVVDFTKVV